MTTISIELPPIEAEKSVEVEVRVNGKGRRYNYRVEVFKWETCSSSELRAECLKRMVSNYERGWELMQIGSPTANEIPITFKRAS
jgi:hypothetical protein